MFLNLLNSADYWPDIFTGNDSKYLPLVMKGSGTTYLSLTSSTWKMNDLFNILNDDPLYIDDIKVDINPITGRTIKEYMKNLF